MNVKSSFFDQSFPMAGLTHRARAAYSFTAGTTVCRPDVMRRLHVLFNIFVILIIVIPTVIPSTLLSAQEESTGDASVSKEELRKTFAPVDSLPKDFQTLVNYLSALIDTGLAYRRYIPPIGCAIMNEDGIVLIGPSSILDRFRKHGRDDEFYLEADVIVPLPDYHLPDSSIHSSLTQIILSTLSSLRDKVRTTAICVSTAVKTADGIIDFVAIQLEHIDGTSMQYLMPYQRNHDNSVVFAKPIMQRAPPFMFRKQ
jgi:hypothetical protein